MAFHRFFLLPVGRHEIRSSRPKKKICIFTFPIESCWPVFITEHNFVEFYVLSFVYFQPFLFADQTQFADRIFFPKSVIISYYRFTSRQWNSTFFRNFCFVRVSSSSLLGRFFCFVSSSWWADSFRLSLHCSLYILSAIDWMHELERMNKSAFVVRWGSFFFFFRMPRVVCVSARHSVETRTDWTQKKDRWKKRHNSDCDDDDGSDDVTDASRPHAFHCIRFCCLQFPCVIVCINYTILYCSFCLPHSFPSKNTRTHTQTPIGQSTFTAPSYYIVHNLSSAARLNF